MMRAAVLGRAGHLEIATRQVPPIGPDDVLVRVHRASLCGTDLKIRSRSFFDGDGPPPGTFTPGHEYAGEVVAVGSSVDEFTIGDRVVSETHRGCMRCVPCLRGAYTECLNYGRADKGHRAVGMTVDGGFADYVVNHVATLHKLPDPISFDEAVALTTAGTVMHAFATLKSLVLGESVVVIGAGPIGLLAIQIAKELGARHVAVLGTRAARLSLARKYGANLVIDARFDDDPVERLSEILGPHGASIVLECSGGASAVDDALKLTRRSGTIVLVGFYAEPVLADLNRAVMNGLTLHAVRGEGSDALARSVTLAAQGRLSTLELITHHFPLEDIQSAFDTYAARADGAIKVMLDVVE